MAGGVIGARNSNTGIAAGFETCERLDSGDN
jgi:hypothetical protein